MRITMICERVEKMTEWRQSEELHSIGPGPDAVQSTGDCSDILPI